MTYKEYTIDSFINAYKRDPITLPKLFLNEIEESPDGSLMVFPHSGILEKYREEMTQYLIRINLTSKEKDLYLYNPKRLSHKLYGTTELWGLILDANEMYTPSQFNISPVYAYTGGIIKFIVEAMNLEKHDKDRNNSYLIGVQRERSVY